MAVRIRFYGVEPTNQKTFLECEAIDLNTLIGIRIEDQSNELPIIIDKPTAIRLVRELRKQISLLD
jgi:hypothetical protein